MKNPESAGWEERFDKEFVREDGLMNKYYFSDKTKEDEFAADVIKEFIRQEKALSEREGYLKGRREGFDKGFEEGSDPEFRRESTSQ